MNEIRDISLAQEGIQKIEWAHRYMPVLNAIRERFRKEQPLKGVNVAVSIHLEAKTANLAIALAEGGANVAVTGCNPLSTQDAVAAGLSAKGFWVNGFHGATDEEYTRHLKKTLDIKPRIVIDDGGDLVHLLQTDYAHLAPGVWGGCEETTTGVRRLHALEAAGKLQFPMLAVNDAGCKHLFDNRHGTGQSVLDGIIRTTNVLLAGKKVVIGGYGWCGRGIAQRASGMGATVIVTEVDPVKALEAMMQGFTVMPMSEAAPIGDIFICATGCKDVITAQHMKMMKDGAILANGGHFDVEINKHDLAALSDDVQELRNNIQGYHLKNGKTLCLLAEGRLVNLAAADGHPVEIMDMSFAVQALAAEYMVKHHQELKNKVYDVPASVDDMVSRTKLSSMGIRIDTLSAEQKAYLEGAGE